MNKERKNQANLIAKECIVSALLQLIKEKPLSAITISELTSRAGVSRMSLYRNYNSKEEIFSLHLQEIFIKYEEEDRQQQLKGIYYDKAHMLHCFQYWYKYRDFFDGLIHCGFGNIFLEYLTGVRMSAAREFLRNQNYSIKEVCSMCGYSDPNYFSRIFKRYEGVTPSEYRERLG